MRDDTDLCRKSNIKNKKDRVVFFEIANEFKELDFQAALLNYMKSQKHQRDQLFEPTSSLIWNIKNQELGLNNKAITNFVSKISNIVKTDYTQEQIDLLENSKIVAVWAVAPKEYSNQRYVEEWNKHHPKFSKQVKTTAVKRIIMGFAYVKRDGTAYNWIIDLGQSISVLLDHAKEQESAKK